MPFQIARVRCFGDANVDFRGTLRCDHVAPCAAVDHAGTDGDASIEARKSDYLLNLPRHLHDGARAACEIDARMRRATSHLNGVVAHSFAFGLELSLQSLAWFQH